jgi:hypothetical protein
LEDDGGITDFAKETIEIIKRADSPWGAMNLDIGHAGPQLALRAMTGSIRDARRAGTYPANMATAAMRRRTAAKVTGSADPYPKQKPLNRPSRHP